MINSLFLVLTVCTLSLQHICKKIYSGKLDGKAVMLFSTFSSLAAALFFIFQIKIPFAMDVKVLPYSLLFGLGYGSAVIFSVLAIACGSLSLTALISSYSLIIPTLYGLIFKGDEISLFLIVGILLLMVSLFLINFVNEKKSSCKITLKWIMFVALSFIGNGLCSTVQNVQIADFGGEFKNEFMTVALLFVVVALFIVSLFTERDCISVAVKKGSLPIIICGLANGACNLLVMILASRLPASVMYPLVSAGSIILTYFISRFFYKEKLSTMQNTGFLLGVLSVVFLNL